MFLRGIFCCRDCVTALSKLPPGLYHFMECRNCEIIISVDTGKFLQKVSFTQSNLHIFKKNLLIVLPYLIHMFSSFLQKYLPILSFLSSKMESVITVENNLP